MQENPSSPAPSCKPQPKPTQFKQLNNGENPEITDTTPTT